MKEILVAIDGSKHSARIVDYASDLAKSTSAKVVLVYVMPEVSIPPGYKEYADVERLDPSSYFDAVGKQVIKDMGERIEKKGVKFEGVYEVGNPAATILDKAKSREAIFIVMGVHGLHGLARIRALGSVARRVIENSSIPVVLVP
jgi:nucleotide-binding universal stress UspA family protein